MTDFGKELRDLRIRVGLTQADLARASNLGQSTISALETGRQGPWPSTRRALARAFHMSLEEFDAALRSETPRPAPGSRRLLTHDATVHQVPAKATGQAQDYAYASAKVLELLSDLGRAEQQLRQYRAAIENVCAAGWTTDATLHVTGCFGPVAAEQRNRHGDFVGRHVTEFFETAWGQASPDFQPLVMQQRAADGDSVGFQWALDGRHYMVFIDPVTDVGGHVVGTVGVAIDVTDRVASEGDPGGDVGRLGAG